MTRIGRISFLFALLSVFFSFQLPSSAQEFGSTFKKQYIGLAGGARNLKISGIDGLNDDLIDYDETDFTYKVYSGRRFTRNFGIEFSVVDYGESEGSLIDSNLVTDNLKVEGWGATLHAVGYLTQSGLSPDSEYGDDVVWFGKIGPAWVDQTVSGQVTDNQGNTATFSEDSTDFGASLGIGTNISLSDNVGLRIEGETVLGLDNNTDTSLYLGYIGVHYKFN